MISACYSVFLCTGINRWNSQHENVCYSVDVCTGMKFSRLAYKCLLPLLQTPLHIAAASTHGASCLEVLINVGADINLQSEDGRTPLHMTAIHGRFTRSKTLIDHGECVVEKPVPASIWNTNETFFLVSGTRM